MKKIVAIVLVFSILLTSALSNVEAKEIDGDILEVNETIESIEEKTNEVEEQVEQADMPMGSWYKGMPGVSTFSERSSNYPEKPSNAIAKGVDLSKWDWEKKDVDFQQLGKNVDFLILRCGYGQNIKSQDDPYFIKSVKACEKYDIPYGVYLYSYALSSESAKNEAQHTLRMLKEADAKPELPVFLDMEDSQQAKKTSSEKYKIAKTYCDMIEDEGYTTGIYANKNWWENYLTHSYFDTTIKWVAQYNEKCTYKKDYAIWQCTESATVSGVAGPVDLNYMIEDIYKKQAEKEEDEVELQAKSYSGTYDGKSHTVTVSGYKSGTEVLYSKDNKTWSTTKPTRKNVGTTTVYYKAIDEQNNEISGGLKIKISARKISSASISSISNKVYTGKQIKPNVTVKYGSTKLTKGKDYTLSYGKNKSTGKATVTVKGIGNFYSTKSLTFYIIPKKVSGITTSKGSKKRSAVVKWKKVTGSSGYRIAYSRKGKNRWSYAIVSSNKKTFTKLNVKTYDIKIRAYKTVSGVRKYGSYSSVKTMKAR